MHPTGSAVFRDGRSTWGVPSLPTDLRTGHPDAASTDASSSTTPTDTPSTTATWPLLDAGTPTDTPGTVTWPLLKERALNQAAPRLAAARESRAAAGRLRIKITIVYESMFGNTRNVAQAISDGVREAYPKAHVECVAVGHAAAELIKSTDLLVFGGPHLRHMATDFSKSAQKGKPKPKASRRASSNLIGGTGFARMVPPAAKGQRGRPCLRFRHSPRLRAGRRRGLRDCPQSAEARHYLVKSPEGFIMDEAHGPLHPGEIERAKDWRAQLVRASVSTTATPAPHGFWIFRASVDESD